MDLASLLIFAGALFVAAGSPGPSIAALVARVVSRGVGGVLPFLAAMWIGEAIWLSLAVFGLAFVAQSFHLVFVAIKWLGVAYLCWLAWRMWTAPVDIRDGAIPRDDSPIRLFFAGMAVTLGNPKIMMFYLALLPTIVDLGWVLAAGQARRLLRSARAVRIANRLSAGTMAGAAAAIAAR